MSRHDYRVLSSSGSEWTRHALVVRDDGARYRVERILGRRGIRVVRVVRDGYIRDPRPEWIVVDEWDEEAAAVRAAASPYVSFADDRPLPEPLGVEADPELTDRRPDPPDPDPDQE